MRSVTVVMVLLIFCSSSVAQELVIRADKFEPKELPTWSKMPSTSPVCNNSVVSTKYLSLFGGERLTPAVMQFRGKVSHSSKPIKGDVSVSDLFLTDGNRTVFGLNFRGGTEGIFSYDEKNGVQRLVDPKKFPGVIAMSRPYLVDGKVMFRALDKKGLHQIFHGDEPLLSETEGIAYLYLPTSKNNQIALKVGYGVPGEVGRANKDQIISFRKGLRSVVAVDQDTSPESPFVGFDNSPIPGGEGSVAFIAEHVKYGRSLWLYKKGKLQMLFSAKESEYDLEYFSPAVSPLGDVVFRVIKNKRRAVFLWSHKSKSISQLMEQGQPVKANEQNIKIIDRPGWPAFSGKPCISDSGDVYIHAVLEDSKSFENRGSGIFKIQLR